MTGFATAATWGIAGLATVGVVTRPKRWPEWIWAVSGAALLVGLGLLPLSAAGVAVGKGLDVYLFLAGMMLLSETARAHGVFDWVATIAVNGANGSRRRLFLLVYLTGVAVTTVMSNDATAVVLTPAVFVAARKARADPLPLLFACALVANAASFLLPISNPANIVLYGDHTPALGAWLKAFLPPSLASIAATLLALGWRMRARLVGQCARDVPRESLSPGGRAALAGIGLMGVLLTVVSALDKPLGLPTAIAGALIALGVSALARRSPGELVRGVSWGVLLLVAGLFVLVEALDCTGVIRGIARLLQSHAHGAAGAAGAGATLAVVSNLMNNLPAGLIASTAVAQAHPPPLMVDALLIGVDLGPNLSVTGSLATVLWLQAIRREGEDVGFRAFLRVGAVAMPLALAAALAARLLAAGLAG